MENGEFMEMKKAFLFPLTRHSSPITHHYLL
jgi:hypothetical protein